MHRSAGKSSVLWDRCVLSPGSQTWRKCSQPLPVWVKMENMMQQAALTERHDWLVQYMEHWQACKGPQHSWAVQWPVINWSRSDIQKSREGKGAWVQLHFSSSLPWVEKDTICCEADPSLLHRGNGDSRTAQEQNELFSLVHLANVCKALLVTLLILSV